MLTSISSEKTAVMPMHLNREALEAANRDNMWSSIEGILDIFEKCASFEDLLLLNATLENWISSPGVMAKRHGAFLQHNHLEAAIVGLFTSPDGARDAA